MTGALALRRQGESESEKSVKERSETIGLADKFDLCYGDGDNIPVYIQWPVNSFRFIMLALFLLSRTCACELVRCIGGKRVSDDIFERMTSSRKREDNQGGKI